jgi:hypothetical protein
MLKNCLDDSALLNKEANAIPIPKLIIRHKNNVKDNIINFSGDKKAIKSLLVKEEK